MSAHLPPGAQTFDIPQPADEPARPPALALNEYAFDITLAAAVRVKAPDEATARRILHERIDGNEANLGAWPNGDPIVCEVSLLGDGPAFHDPNLYEVNGEPV